MRLSHLALWVALAAIALAVALPGGIFDQFNPWVPRFEVWCFDTFGVPDGVFVFLAAMWTAVAGELFAAGAVAFKLHDFFVGVGK
jgi:hypothetical protein